MTSEEKADDFADHKENVIRPDNLNSPSPAEETTHPETSTSSSSSAADEQQKYPNENMFSENHSFNSSNNNTVSDNSFKNTTENTANTLMPSVATSNLGANANIAASSSGSSTNNGNHKKIFEVLYLGSANIDKRYSSPHFVMPWVMVEVKRKTEHFREIKLEVRDVSLRGTFISRDEGEFYPDHIVSGHGACLSGSGSEDSTVTPQGRQVILFEHKLHGVSRFAKLHQEPRCFAYLTRPQLNSDYHCHVFMSPEEHQVSCEKKSLFG